jgi:hypothetical protein
MIPDDKKRAYRKDLLLASAMVVAGLATSGFALARIAVDHRQEMAQATQPLQGSPAPTDEPARPDAQAQQEGAKPALPPAPAEKTAPPISEKK